jgi:ribosomal protein S18 acetylase RimI-like enzyme
VILVVDSHCDDSRSLGCGGNPVNCSVSGVEFKELREIDLNTVDQLHFLFPHWKKSSIQKKISNTLGGCDKRFVALLNGRIVAHLRLVNGRGLHKHRVEITSLIVDSLHRRRHIGLCLLEFVLCSLPETKKLVLLAVDSKNAPAIKLYKKVGFRKYGLLKKASLVENRFVDNYLMSKEI